MAPKKRENEKVLVDKKPGLLATKCSTPINIKKQDN
jgi:hypothetical protein